MNFNRFDEKSVPTFYYLQIVNPRNDVRSNILDGAWAEVHGGGRQVGMGGEGERVRVENTSIEKKGARPGESITSKNIYSPYNRIATVNQVGED